MIGVPGLLDLYHFIEQIEADGFECVREPDEFGKFWHFEKVDRPNRQVTAWRIKESVIAWRATCYTRHIHHEKLITITTLTLERFSVPPQAVVAGAVEDVTQSRALAAAKVTT